MVPVRFPSAPLCFVASVLFLACAAAAISARASDELPEITPWPAHERRIIVKYGPRIEGCAHCLLARAARFSDQTKSDSLDRLHARFHVEGAKGLFLDHHGSGVKRGAAMVLAGDETRAKFRERAARAPFGSSSPDLSNVFVVRIDRGVDPVEAARAFSADPDVEYAEPDYLMSAQFVPNDPFFSSSGSIRAGLPDLWGHHALDATNAWDIATGAGITVAVVDTGIKHRHPDIRDSIWFNPGEVRNKIDDDGNGYVDDLWGWNFDRNKNKPKDRHGHGTHVAGTIAATANNGMGIAGLAFGSRVMSVVGLDRRGNGWSSDLAKCILYAAENGADVINNSWGGFRSYAVDDAITAAKSLGAVVVFAAGNDGSTYMGQAANPEVIAVTAVEEGDVFASFSNRGDNASVAAPGVDVLSLSGPRRVGGVTIERRYRSLAGTSMAAPHASAAAALLLENDPTLTTEEVRWHLELNADQPGYPGYEGLEWNPAFGWGRINALQMFNEPPVTIRMREAPVSLHAIEGSSSSDVFDIDFAFTTHDSVPWTVTAPPWLSPDSASGDWSATVSFDLDASALSIGTYSGPISVTAPSTVNGAAGTTASVDVHSEQRAGPEFVVEGSWAPWSVGPWPNVLSDGSGVMVAWMNFAGLGTQNPGLPAIRVSYVSDDGTVTGPTTIYEGIRDFFSTKIYDTKIRLAYDGTNFLVAWIESFEEFKSETGLRTKQTSYLKALRISWDGTVLDPAPVELASMVENETAIGGFDRSWYNLDVGFDGSNYTMTWRQIDFGSSKLPLALYMARLSPGGVPLGDAVQVIPGMVSGLTYSTDVAIACRDTGVCLWAWIVGDGETNEFGKYIYKVYGQRWNGATPIDPAPYRLMTDLNGLQSLIATEHGWFLSGERYLRPAQDEWGYGVYGARIATDGSALDPDGIRLDWGPAAGFSSVAVPDSAVWDGQHYIVRWSIRAPGIQEGPLGPRPTYYPFATRISPGGVVVDSEIPGLMLGEADSYEAANGVLAVTPTKSLMFRFTDRDQEGLGAIMAQGVFER